MQKTRAEVSLVCWLDCWLEEGGVRLSMCSFRSRRVAFRGRTIRHSTFDGCWKNDAVCALHCETVGIDLIDVCLMGTLIRIVVNWGSLYRLSELEEGRRLRWKIKGRGLKLQLACFPSLPLSVEQSAPCLTDKPAHSHHV
jgi:hypothetical protein